IIYFRCQERISRKLPAENKHAKAGQAGLYNLGNTCFMNSGLQSMLSTTPLLKYFLDKYLEAETMDKDSTLAIHFIYLACKYWSGNFSIIYPREFKNALGLQHSQFQDYRQHDCQEFLALLLDTLHEQTIRLDQSLPQGSQIQTGDQNLNDTDCIEQELNNSMRMLPDSGDESHPEVDEPDLKQRDQSFCTLDSRNITLPNNKSGNVETVKTTSKSADDSVNHIAHTENIHKILELPPLQSDSDNRQEVLGLPCENLQEVLNNAVNLKQKIPLFEQFYSKDTKTLNTNMLVNEYTEDSIAVDSDKFSKPDNISNQDNSIEVNLASLANEPVHFNVEMNKDGSPSKGLKDTNIWADKKNTCRLSKMCSDDLFFSEDRITEGDIKRMRFEKTEKNLQQQELSKFNKVVFQMSSSGDCNKEIESCKTVNNTSDMKCQSEFEYQDNSDDETASVNEISEDFAGLQQCEEEILEADIEAAEKAWEAYIKQHKQSIIVICSAYFVTNTGVILLTSKNQPVQYLLTMNKNDKIFKLKQELCSMALIDKDEGESDIVMAEVLNSHISRILEDNVMLRYVNDSSRKIYAFQVKSFKLEDETLTSTKTKNNSAVPAYDDIFTGMSMFSTAEMQQASIHNQNVSSYSTDKFTSETFFEAGNNMEAPLVTGIESCKILPENIQDSYTISQGLNGKSEDHPIPEFSMETDVNEKEVVVCEDGSSSVKQGQDNVCLSDIYMQDVSKSEHASQSDQWTEVTDGHFVSEDNTLLTAPWDWSNKDNSQGTDLSSAPQWEATVETSSSIDNGNMSSSAMASVTMVDQWKSCAICLEELSDPELLMHTNCKGTFCQSCLEMSFKHYGSEVFCCPVCSTLAVMTEDFLPLSDNCDQPTQLRVILVDVTFLMENEDHNDRRLMGHPRLLYLPSQMDGQQLRQQLDTLIPLRENYIVRFTDGQGLKCSRCPYTSHCQGCLVPKEGEVTLRPGDHLTVCFHSLPMDLYQAAAKYDTDRSMENLRPDKPLSIYDCIKAFTDRFMYHDLSSTKVDCQVIFPLENLDLGQFISGPATNSLQYDLYSIICHFGAFTKHPLDGSWYYYNDETVTKQAPSHNDYSNAYILFYQRQGSEVSFDIPSKLKSLTLEKLSALCQSSQINNKSSSQIDEKSDVPVLE
ncbi:hypothetical protein KUTeg_011765, partial [Tegillarca granosa]